MGRTKGKIRIAGLTNASVSVSSAMQPFGCSETTDPYVKVVVTEPEL